MPLDSKDSNYHGASLFRDMVGWHAIMQTDPHITNTLLVCKSADTGHTASFSNTNSLKNRKSNNQFLTISKTSTISLIPPLLVI